MNLSVRNLTKIVVVLLLAALGVVMVEAAAYLTLRVTNPERARRVLARHAWVGSPLQSARRADPTRRTLGRYPIHPLFGWYPRDGAKHRDRFGYRVNHPSDTVSLRTGADVRIFLVGGSTVAGPGHAPDRTLSAHLERLLADRAGLDASVVNAGVGGWYSAQETALLTQRILPFFRPDLVILLDGFNELGVALHDVRAGTTGGRTARDHPSGDPLHHEILLRYRRQFQKLNAEPTFVLAQLLSTLGLRRHLYLPNYFLGHLLPAASSGTPASSSVRRFERKLDRLQREAVPELSDEERRRLRRRLKTMKPSRREKLDRALSGFNARERTVVRKIAANLPSRRWKNFRYILGSSPENVRSVVAGRIADYLPEEVHRLLENRDCRNVQLDVGRYVGSVRSALGAARGHGVRVVHALQPTIVYKPLTWGERQMVQHTRIKSYLGRFQRYRRGRICFVRAVRRFFDAARPRLAGLARQYPDASSPVLADLSKLFARERARIFTDIVHYNARGNRLLAEALYGKIRDVIPETANGRSGR